MSEELDSTDLAILNELQANGRLTTAELAQRVNLSQSPCWRRVNKLESEGVIRGYHAEVSRRIVGLGAMVFVMISIDYQSADRLQEFQDAVVKIPEVVMFHSISGSEDFILVVLTKDLEAFSDLLHDKLHRLPGLARLQTYFSLREIKGRMAEIPIPL
ncbi:Lrp/AsnC family transcriptional regulator [Paraburkholderia flagellata]|uniref:Lrp/AsnC family transcriptional regulator n=1 Tax=Paraburkholderia flagellata TaxID=2883241 RepID=UPI001F25ED0D|nr:Lrp/AsnC family transcriptional regulator [Paraburkholderia flagellata]